MLLFLFATHSLCLLSLNQSDSVSVSLSLSRGCFGEARQRELSPIITEPPIHDEEKTERVTFSQLSVHSQRRICWRAQNGGEYHCPLSPIAWVFRTHESVDPLLSPVLNRYM